MQHARNLKVKLFKQQMHYLYKPIFYSLAKDILKTFRSKIKAKNVTYSNQFYYRKYMYM